MVVRYGTVDDGGCRSRLGMDTNKQERESHKECNQTAGVQRFVAGGEELKKLVRWEELELRVFRFG